MANHLQDARESLEYVSKNLPNDDLNLQALLAIGHAVVALVELLERNAKNFMLDEKPTWIKVPKVVCLCGSTRFSEAFQKAGLEETLAGKIVLSIGCDMWGDDTIFANFSAAEWEQAKAKLDELHLRKIDLANEILILNVGGYIGESTGRELEYARQHGKRIRFLEGSPRG